MSPSPHNETARLEAFSDGVLAIIITIMVLELRPPHEPTVEAILPLLPTFLSYALSFLMIAIYWNNHHHLLHATEDINGKIMWANMHLLFWLSLIPFATAWMGENSFAKLPIAVYGTSLLAPAIAYFILQSAIVRRHGKDGTLARALGADWKGKLSPIAYLAGIALAFIEPRASEAIYVAVALLWLVPDRRIERRLAARTEHDVS